MCVYVCVHVCVWCALKAHLIPANQAIDIDINRSPNKNYYFVKDTNHFVRFDLSHYYFVWVCIGNTSIPQVCM